MEISNWNIFYKYKQSAKVRPNLVYVPYINPSKDIFCMDYNINKSYFFDRPLYNEEVCQFYFNNELRWIEHFKNEQFAPEILEIDTANRRIFFKWYDSSLNHIIENKQYSNMYIDQIESILKTLESSVYKINYYPHTCYVATDNLIKIHDFYGCVSKTSHYLPKDKLIPILGKMDVWRFGQYESDGLINMQQVYEMAFKVNSGEWPVIGNIK